MRGALPGVGRALPGRRPSSYQGIHRVTVTNDQLTRNYLSHLTVGNTPLPKGARARVTWRHLKGGYKVRLSKNDGACARTFGSRRKRKVCYNCHESKWHWALLQWTPSCHSPRRSKHSPSSRRSRCSKSLNESRCCLTSRGH